MATEIPHFTIGHLPAGADLSSNQYQVVTLNSSGQWVLDDGSAPLGVLRNKPSAAGRAAEVVVAGVIPIKVGASGVTQGGAVAVDANGDVNDAGSGDTIFGYALEAGADGEFVSILLVRQGATA